VSDDLKLSAGQLLSTPLQFSATSQSPADSRQRVVSFASFGHVAEFPEHFSSASQAPAETLHISVAGLKESAGQILFAPSHFSAASQTPADARHSTSVVATASFGHDADEPVQLSATSQIPSAALQSVSDDLYLQVAGLQQPSKRPPTASHSSFALITPSPQPAIGAYLYLAI